MFEREPHIQAKCSKQKIVYSLFHQLLQHTHTASAHSIYWHKASSSVEHNILYGSAAKSNESLERSFRSSCIRIFASYSLRDRAALNKQPKRKHIHQDECRRETHRAK